MKRPENGRRFMDSPDVLALFSSDFPRVNPELVDVRDDIDRSTLLVSSSTMDEEQRRLASWSLLNANHSVVRSMSLHGVPRASERASKQRAACVTPFNRLGVRDASTGWESAATRLDTRLVARRVDQVLFFPPRRILITAPRNHPPFT